MTNFERTELRYRLLAWTIPDLIEGMPGHDAKTRLDYIHSDLVANAYEKLSREALGHLLAYLVACARDAQMQDPELTHEVFLLFHRLKSRFIEPFRLWVHGLAQEHEPEGDSWQSDMRLHADRLLGLLELEELQRPDHASSSERERLPSPPWPERGLESAVVWVVGGARRSHTLKRLCESTGAAKAYWLELGAGGNTRRLHSLASKVRNGSVQAVFVVVPLASHEATGMLRRAASDSPSVVCMTRGYGNAQLRESYLESLPQEEAP